MSLARASLLSFLLITSGACGQADDPCGAATAHLESCFGVSAMGAFPDCDARADELLAMSCEQLGSTLLDSKADTGVSEQIRAAVKKAIREAVMLGIQQAIEAVWAALGTTTPDKPFYVIFYQDADEAKVQAKAGELAAILAADPAYDPRVLEHSDKYLIVHHPCPLKLDTDLSAKITDLVLSYPELITAIGGEMSKEKTEDGFNLHVELPLSFIEGTESFQEALGCK